MTQEKTSKHIKSFWPLFGLVIMSMILGGIIYAVAFGNMLQDDLNSDSFGSLHHTAQPKTPATIYKQ